MRKRATMVWGLAGWLFLSGLFLSGLVHADCQINVDGMTITGTQAAGSQLTFSVNASDSCSKTLYYRFSMHPYYGESGYDGKQWQSMTATEWVSTASVNYTFSSPGKYIVVVWVSASTTSVDATGITIFGCSVDVTATTPKTTITGFGSSGTAMAGSAMTFTANAQNSASQALYYRFSVHPYYGTSGYDGRHWQSMTSTEWVSGNSISYTFGTAGKYIVVVWVSTTTTTVSPTGIPIIGWSVDVAANPSANNKPIASPVSMSVDSSVPYFQQQLVGSDPDGDTISYELVSASSGVGYSMAYVNAQTGMLYITNEPSGNNAFTIYYRVTDGQLFSDSADVTVNVSYVSGDENDLGRNEIDPRTYSQIETSTYSSDLLGNVDADATQPSSVDLSPNFPVPGSQGSQSSCVGWATAYALKSYQERIEVGWSLNSLNHLFSPAYVYNQINGGQDRGSYISDALDLAVNQGIATLSTMSYSESDYLTQPTAQARVEAGQYKAKKRVRINDTSQIKAALVNRKPVVCGIMVYESLYSLKGVNSVYNTTTGSKLGGHAVTIVGYDDNKFGGAFKIINSWGQSFGDGGFFWLPYSSVSQVELSESYVLEDGENGTTTTDDEPTEPTPEPSSLPNLSVSSWEITYNPRPGGAGELVYVVANTGTGTAAAGANVNLILSENAVISSNDYYVVYEDIPFDLEPGYTVYRNENNSISFRFPDQLRSGVYYMGLWVDDLNEVTESNENDNISMGSGTLTIENTLPDLNVNSWYATWDGYGNGSLTYEIANIGGTTTRTTLWNLYLLLDGDQTMGNGNEIILFYESAGFLIPPNQVLYRDAGSAAYFNLFYDYLGYAVPPGTYYMALLADGLNAEAESNEYNNQSYSWGTVTIPGYSYSPAKQAGQVMVSGNAYNARDISRQNIAMQKVEISRSADGGVSMKLLEPMVKARSLPKEKRLTSGSRLIFPVTNRLPMPEGE